MQNALDARNRAVRIGWVLILSRVVERQTVGPMGLNGLSAHRFMRALKLTGPTTCNSPVSRHLANGRSTNRMLTPPTESRRVALALSIFRIPAAPNFKALFANDIVMFIFLD